MKLPSKVTICEVGLRDGLQNESKILETQQKYQLVEKLMEAGVKVIELGSFMNPKAVPQMADTDDLYRMVSQKEGTEFRALVANKKGVDRAIACGCKKIKLNVSASLAHNLANINKTPEESVAGFEENVQLARENGLEVSGSISMPFASPWEGRTPIEQVEKIIEAYLQVGVSEISLSDASGMAVPNQVYDLCTMVQKKYPAVRWWLHFHNTRGMGMANILAAMEAGITQFDASLGGLGGCPFVPGAAGNVTTEDVVHMMDEMGVYTGIDLLKLMDVAREMQYFVGHATDSYVLKAGRSKDLIR
ncbi:MAG: hydroxymethylglutaryl-CoA lyase [Peptostreptococcaceae bacterium]|nr:hydroxymethylglutaryl-CoA lyase [Peptostreptococcaceae bacterium]